MRKLVLALAAGALLIGDTAPAAIAGDRPAASQPSAAATACPRYATLMRAASQALQRGDRATALGHLRAARTALESCSRGGTRGNGLARSPQPRGASA